MSIVECSFGWVCDLWMSTNPLKEMKSDISASTEKGKASENDHDEKDDHQQFHQGESLGHSFHRSNGPQKSLFLPFLVSTESIRIALLDRTVPLRCLIAIALAHCSISPTVNQHWFNRWKIVMDDESVKWFLIFSNKTQCDKILFCLR